MKNKFGIEIDKVNPGRRVLLQLGGQPLEREEATVDGVMKNNGGNFVSIYVTRADGSRARVGFDQIAGIVTRVSNVAGLQS